MVSGKNRLYVALYPSGVTGNEERKYHWGFIVGPKDERGVAVPGLRYHVKNTPLGGWVYERVSLVNVKTTVSLLARILIAKIEDEERLVKIFEQTPVVQNNPEWRCRTWVATVLSRLAEDGKVVGTAQLDWATIEAFARSYVAEKAAGGRYALGTDLALPKPTWDLLDRKETVP